MAGKQIGLLLLLILQKICNKKIRTNFQRWNHCFNFNGTLLFYRCTFIFFKNLQKLICTEEPQIEAASAAPRVVFAVEVYDALAYFFNKFSAIRNYRYSLRITQKMLNLEWNATTYYKNWNSERQKD